MTNLKIILADDDYSLRETLAAYIFSMFPKSLVDQASDGTSLVDMVRRYSYSFVFSDYHMPIMDGLEAVRVIREFDARVPIYLMSADDTVDAVGFGATGYIHKPNVLTELSLILRQGLQL